ncbi:MAG TPA: D-aminoacylase, partial [Xanthobacteraceae bacterium]
MRHDILIRNGLLIDGSGNPGIVGDLAIAGGRIAAAGPKLAVDAHRVIDAGGLVVAPGFIDI